MVFRKCFPVAWGRSLVRPRAFGVLWRFCCDLGFLFEAVFPPALRKILNYPDPSSCDPKVKNLTVLGISFGGLLLGDRVKRSGSF